MATRYVTHARKDHSDNITHLGKPGEWWSVRSEPDIISDIRRREHTYWVPFTSGTVKIVVKQGKYRLYLVTEPDQYGQNNLDNLPPI